MRITASADVDRVKEEDFRRFVAIYLGQVSQILGNNLSFDENFNAKTLTINFPAANLEVAAIHGLGRAPIGYFQVGQTAAMSIYDGSSANTASLIYLRSNAVGTCRLVVY